MEPMKSAVEFSKLMAIEVMNINVQPHASDFPVAVVRKTSGDTIKFELAANAAELGVIRELYPCDGWVSLSYIAKEYAAEKGLKIELAK